MVKRQRGSSSNAKSKVMFENEDASIDRISMLPDAILVLILSLLTFKESIATSILSQRWRYVWTLVPKLDFNGIKSLSNVDMERDQRWVIYEERSKYIGWVDRVITFHKSSVIEEFRVNFSLTKLYEKYIDKWVKYALDRKVKRLELNLTYTHDVFSRRSTHDFYTFPYQYMRQYMESCSRQLNSIHFKFLEKISLAHVNVNGGALEFFLSNCLLLQHLSVSESKELTFLRVIGPFPSLKRLEIISCLNLNLFEVRDSNLVYLKYIGESLQYFLLQNVPQLVEICIGGTMNMESIVSMFSSILPQVERCKILIGCLLCWEETEMLYAAMKMSKLKKLVVTPFFTGSLLPLTKLIQASPYLETFVLEIPHRGTRFKKSELLRIEGSYTHLKEVIFRGYFGLMSDVEFVKHLSDCASVLEKIVIDPCKPDDNPCECFWKNNNDLKEMSIGRKRKARALTRKQLVGILSPRIDLQIL